MAWTPANWLGPVAVVGLLTAVGVGTYLLQPHAPAASASGPVAQAGDATQPLLARVTNAARALKLITWAFETTLDARVVSDKWYGDVTAQVHAPVRYQYGVDLDSLRAEDAFYDSANERYVFLVEPPQRLSCEIDVEQLEQRLTATGMRWKSQNAAQADAARRILAQRAQRLILSEDDERRLRDVSREQLEGHLRQVLARFAGAETNVVVRFSE